MPYCIVFFQVYIQSIHVCVSYLVCVSLSLTCLSLFDILTNRILSCILIFFLLKPLFFCILQIFCCIISVVPFLCYLCVVNMRECLYMVWHSLWNGHSYYLCVFHSSSFAYSSCVRSMRRLMCLPEFDPTWISPLFKWFMLLRIFFLSHNLLHPYLKYVY